ncbi:MAG: gamma-glutamylcyclotransferase [Pseudomonadota bacterium]
MHALSPITTRPLWVFGYGSLMWNPGFPVARSVLATLPGWRRRFCMRSIHHRGTVSEPGLVLALDAQTHAFCRGLAFQVVPGAENETVDELRARELISSAYLERELVAQIDGEGATQVLTYIVDTHHDQYVGDLSLEDQAQIIAGAVGGRGPNDEYLRNTAQHLHELAIADAELDWLVARVQAIQAEQPTAVGSRGFEE